MNGGQQDPTKSLTRVGARPLWMIPWWAESVGEKVARGVRSSVSVVIER